jgi:malate synthase
MTDTENRVSRETLQVSESLAHFIENDVLPGTDISPDTFWGGMAELAYQFGPSNASLLIDRANLQKKIDIWHRSHRGLPHKVSAYKAYLEEIGYLVAEGEDFAIETDNVDPEIATMAGPQLVVPSTNARFVLNAANARWGSLYDAFYGTDALGDSPPKGGFDQGRAARVVARVNVILDEKFAIKGMSHSKATRYEVVKGSLIVDGQQLIDPDLFVGFTGHASSPSSIVLRSNHLHVILQFDRDHPIGNTSAAGLSDVVIESALSAIVDLEDSVACVDAEDKVLAYSNWLGLMKGHLSETFDKNGQAVTRTLNPDRTYNSPDGGEMTLHGRALLLIRNVGHLMTNSAIIDKHGNEIFEGLMDALVTTAIFLHDDKSRAGLRNSRTGSMYVVKPKMHGPAEVAFANDVFSHVEKVLGLPKYTVKLGIMDEERRTSVNLKECIRAAKNRICFINTGFLDRTGDEIHTSMEAGPFSRKDFIKRKGWITAYEDQNVDIGLECGFSGRAQIGKGMWAAPDNMAEMMEQKIGHPKAGANCAWVPSPTAATLHALHYHRVDVSAIQALLAGKGRRAYVEALLQIPTASYKKWTRDQIHQEVENNAQGILGYVVRWIDQGIGCSKVPDINDVGLMEDRATCRISAQHIANWLHHDIISRNDTLNILKRMAAVVDSQNQSDPNYKPMAPNFDGIAFKAACDLVFEGVDQPSGYTEPALHARRLEWKAEQKRQVAKT